MAPHLAMSSLYAFAQNAPTTATVTHCHPYSMKPALSIHHAGLQGLSPTHTHCCPPPPKPTAVASPSLGPGLLVTQGLWRTATSPSSKGHTLGSLLNGRLLSRVDQAKGPAFHGAPQLLVHTLHLAGRGQRE